MPRSEHNNRTISSVKSGHLTSVICGQLTSALTRADGVSPEELLDEIKRLSSDSYEAHPGARAKHTQRDVFKALALWLKQAWAQNRKRPSQNKMVQFLIEQFQYKQTRATELARIFRLWHLTGVAKLTSADRAFLKKTFPRDWRASEKRSKAVQEIFAAQREAQAMLGGMRQVAAMLQRRYVVTSQEQGSGPLATRRADKPAPHSTARRTLKGRSAK
jgi:hypothetical protein